MCKHIFFAVFTEIYQPLRDIILKSAEFKEIAAEVSDKAITLVKNTGISPLPLSVKEHKRILIVPQETANPFAFMMGGKNKKKPVEYLKEKLEAEGFEVTIYESMMDKILKAPRKQKYFMQTAWDNN